MVQKEIPGFIAIRLEVALMKEALSMVQRGIASPEDIDTVLKTGHPLNWVAAGIFERVEDGIGWDLILAGVQRVLPDIDSSMDVMKLIQEKVNWAPNPAKDSLSGVWIQRKALAGKRRTRSLRSKNGLKTACDISGLTALNPAVVVVVGRVVPLAPVLVELLDEGGQPLG